jgi:hypothetical protein
MVKSFRKFSLLILVTILFILGWLLYYFSEKKLESKRVILVKDKLKGDKV